MKMELLNPNGGFTLDGCKSKEVILRHYLAGAIFQPSKVKLVLRDDFHTNLRQLYLFEVVWRL